MDTAELVTSSFVKLVRAHREKALDELRVRPCAMLILTETCNPRTLLCTVGLDFHFSGAPRG